MIEDCFKCKLVLASGGMKMKAKKGQIATRSSIPQVHPCQSEVYFLHLLGFTMGGLRN